MADDQFKYRITAETDDATRKLREHGDAVQDADRKVDQAGRTADETRGRFGKLSDSLGGVVRGWIGLAAVAGAIIGFFRELGSAAREAAQAVQDVGRGMRGLAVNVGGERADALMGQINAIARDNRFNAAGRGQLVEAATAITDFRPDATNDQITATLGNLAMLQRATGVGGQEGFRTINSLQANLGLAEDEAVDVATTLVNSGFEAQTVQQLAERGGNVGGLDFMALLLAARGQGLNVAQSGEQVETLIGALTRRGADGGLAPELVDLGVNGNMSLTQRLAFLSEGRRSGRISRGQFERAIGGAQNLKVVAPLQRALASPGALASARATLGDDQAVENAIAALLQSDAVRAQEAADARELQRQRAIEESGLGGLGERLDEAGTTFSDAGGGSATLGFLRSLVDPVAAMEAEARTLYARGIRSPQLTPEAAARAVGVSVEEYLRNTQPAVESPAPVQVEALTDEAIRAGYAAEGRYLNPNVRFNLPGEGGTTNFFQNAWFGTFPATEGEPPR